MSLINLPVPIEAITWENLRQVMVLGALLSIFMQLIGKSFVDFMIGIVLHLALKIPKEAIIDWPGRTPAYFTFMLILSFGLLLLTGLEPGPAFVSAIVSMFVASGEYETLKSITRGLGRARP